MVDETDCVDVMEVPPGGSLWGRVVGKESGEQSFTGILLSQIRVYPISHQSPLLQPNGWVSQARNR